MEIDVQAEQLIARPRAEVAAYMFDPANDAAWIGGVLEARALSDGPLQPGARVERVASFLGRRFTYVTEVLSFEPERMVEMRATQPFEIRVRYELAEQAGQTLVRIRAAGGGTGFFKLAAPLLGAMVRRNIAGDLQRLQTRLAALAARGDGD